MDDIGKQKADVEEFIQRKVNAILISPKVAEGLTPVVNRAYDSGIPRFRPGQGSGQRPVHPVRGQR